MARFLSILRRAIRIALGAFAALLLLGALGLGFLLTPWGKATLCDALVRGARPLFQGRLTLGRLSGSLFREVVLEDVAITDADGRPAISIQRLSLAYRLLPLLQNRLEIPSLSMVGLSAHVSRSADGKINLSDLLRAPVSSEPARPAKTPWTVAIEAIRIQRAGLRFQPAAGDAVTLTDLEALARCSYRPNELSVVVERLAVRWEEEPRSFAFQAEIKHCDGQLRLERLLLQSGQSHLALKGVPLREGMPVGGTGELVLDPTDTAALVPALSGKGAMRLQLSLEPSAADRVPGISLRGEAVGVPLQLEIRLPERWRVLDLRLLQAGPVDPRKFDGRLPRGSVRLALDGRLAGTSLSTLKGQARATLQGELEGVPLSRIEASARLSGGRVNLRLDGSGVQGVFRAEAALALGSRPWVLDSLRVDGRLERGFPGRFRLRASGPLDDLDLSGTVDLRPWQTGETRIGRTQVELRFHGLPWRPHGEGRIALGRLRLGGREVGAVGVALRLDPAGDHLRFALDLEAAAIPVALFADGLVRRRDGKAIALESRAQVKSQGLGSLEGALRVALPADPFDPGAWKKQGLGALQALSLKLSAVDLGLALRRAGLESGVRGRLEGTLTLGERACTGSLAASFRRVSGAAPIQIQLSIPDLKVPFSKEPFSVSLDTAVAEDQTSAALTMTWINPALANLQLGIQAGLRAILARDWPLWGRAPIRGTLEVQSFPLAIIASLLRLDQDAAGQLTAHGALEGTLLKPVGTLQLEGRALALVGLGPGDLSTTIEMDLDRLSLNGQAALGQGGEINWSASKSFKGAFVQEMSVQAKDLRLKPLSRFLLHLGGKPWLFDGVVDAHLAVSGPLDKLRQTGSVHLREGELTLPWLLQPLRAVDLTGGLDQDKLTLSLTGACGQGQARLTAEGTLDGLVPAKAKARLVAAGLPVLVEGKVISLDTEVQVTAGREGELWRMDAAVGKTLIRLPKKTGRQLHPIGLMSDVVFMGEASALNRQAAEPVASRPAKTQPGLRISISAPETIRVRDQNVQAKVRADLALRTLDQPLTMLGVVEVTQGRVSLFDLPYDIETARLSFRGGHPPDPDIQVRVSRDFSAVRVIILVQGRASRPRVQLLSDPTGYDEAQLLSFVMGSSPAAADQPSSSLEDRALGMTSGMLLNLLPGTVKKLIPLDTFRADRDTSKEGPSTKLLMGRWITANVFLGYRYSTSAEPNENKNEANVEYHLGRSWTVEGNFGDNGKGGLDILWMRRF